jgi:hypothetical protein
VTAWRSACALSVVVLLLTPSARADTGTVPSRRLFSFQGDDVYESSGLVDGGSIVYTNNDSGDRAVIYGVDPRTGRTISRTRYADSVTDVESIAPGTRGTLWAGDTGDNRKNRHDIAVYRMRPRDGRQPAAKYPLSYPDGPHDDETLLVQPQTQRVFVVSKSVFGGTVYAAPRDLREQRRNRLRAYARVSGLVTDGSFFPDGKHVVLRTYGTASVYTFPGFELVGTVDLPTQPQGEGISVSRTGRVLISSEGVQAEVLQVTLPASLTAPAPTAPRTRGPSPDARPPVHPAPAARDPRDAGDWLGIGGVVAVGAALVYLVLRGSRRRGAR